MQDLMIFLTNHLALTYVAATALLLLVIIEILRLKRQHYRIDVSKAVQLINRENASVIDIRSDTLFRQGHILAAKSLPANELLQNPTKLDKLKQHPLILVCNNGQESQKLAASLQKQGYNVFMLAGGLRAWSEANMPLVKE